MWPPARGVLRLQMLSDISQGYHECCPNLTAVPHRMARFLASLDSPLVTDLNFCMLLPGRPTLCCRDRQSVIPPPPRDALEGRGPQRGAQRRLGRRLEEVAKAIGGGYCRLQMPLQLALGVRET